MDLILQIIKENIDKFNWKTHAEVVEFLKEKNIEVSQSLISRKFKALNIELKVVEGIGVIYRSSDTNYLTLCEYLTKITNRNHFTTQIQVFNYLKSKKLNVSNRIICTIFKEKNIKLRVIEGKGLFYRAVQSGYLTLEEYLVKKIDQNDWKNYDEISSYLAIKKINLTNGAISGILKKQNIKLRVIEGKGTYFKSTKINHPSLKKYIEQIVDQHEWKKKSDILEYCSKKVTGITEWVLNKTCKDNNIKIRVVEGKGLFYQTAQSGYLTLANYLQKHIDQNEWETYQDVIDFLTKKHISISRNAIAKKFKKLNIKKVFDPRLQREIYRSSEYYKSGSFEVYAHNREDSINQKILLEQVDKQSWKSLTDAAQYVTEIQGKITDVTVSLIFASHAIEPRVIEGKGIFYRSSDSGHLTLVEYLEKNADLHNWSEKKDAHKFLESKKINVSLSAVSNAFGAGKIELKVVEGKGEFYRSKNSQYPTLDTYLQNLVDQNNWKTQPEIKNYLNKQLINVSVCTISNKFKELNIKLCVVEGKGEFYRSKNSGYPILEEYLNTLIDKDVWDAHYKISANLAQSNIFVSTQTIRTKLIAINAKKIFDPGVGKKVYRSQKKCLEIAAGHTDTQNFLNDVTGDQVKRAENEIIIRRMPVTPEERIKRHNQALWKKYQKELQEKQQEILELARQSDVPNQKFVYKPYEKETFKGVFFKTADGSVYLKEYTIAPLKINQIPNILQAAKAQGNVIQLAVIPEQSQQVNMRIVGRDGSVRMTGGGSDIGSPRGLLKSGPGSQEGRIINMMKQSSSVTRSSANGALIKGPGFQEVSRNGVIVNGPGSFSSIRLVSKAAGGYIGLFIVAPAVYKNVKTIAITDESKERNSAYMDLGFMAGSMWAFTRFIASKYPKTAAVIMVGTAGEHMWESARPLLRELEKGQRGMTICYTDEKAYLKSGVSCTDGRKVELLNPHALRYANKLALQKQ